MFWNTDPETINEHPTASSADVPPHVPANQESTQEEIPEQQPETTNDHPAELMVCQGAKCTCDKAVDPSPKELKVLSHSKYVINDNGESKLLATNREKTLNNLNFGKCKVPDPNKPVPCTAKLEWKDYYERVQLPDGAYVLTEKSTAICSAKGGNIKIVQHGQQANITTQEVEQANTSAWAAEGPLLTEEFIVTQEVAKDSDEDGASVKSVNPLLYASNQPLNTPVTFKATFDGSPTEAAKQGVNWIIYDEHGAPMQLRSDAGETLTATFKKPGKYLVEAYGKKSGDKTATLLFDVKANEIDEVATTDGNQKVRTKIPVEFRLKSSFPGLPLPFEKETISWTVNKTGGKGTPVLLVPNGPSTQVICDEETTYVVAAYVNGVSRQSKAIHALNNGIVSVSASKSSSRINDEITFTVKDQFKISPATAIEQLAVKWICKDAEGIAVAAFTSKKGETISHVFDQPGEYTIQPFMIQPAAKVAVKIVVSQPEMLTASWEFPEGGKKSKTGWDEANRPVMTFRSAENLMVDLEYGHIDKDGHTHPLLVVTGFKIGADQKIDLKGHDFIPAKSKYSKVLKEGSQLYFKVINKSTSYNILNTSMPQPVNKLKLVTGEEIVGIEFLKEGKPVINAKYGDHLQCRVRTRNLSAEKVTVKICRQEKFMNVDELRPDTPFHNKVYSVPAGGVILFDFTLDSTLEKGYSEKLHYFYALVSENETFGTSRTLVAFKNNVPANGGKVMAGIDKVEEEQTEPGDCPRCNALVTADQMRKIFPRGNVATLKEAADTYNKYMKLMGMNTCWNKAHFLAQASVEVGETFTIRSAENFNYYKPVLISKFGAFQTKEGKIKAEEWGRKVKLKGKPGYVAVSQETQEKIANWAYSPGSKTGKQLRNTKADDGYKYCGKGLIQLTGRGNYSDANKYTLKYENVDILDDPEQLLKSTKIAVLSSMAYWVNRGINKASNGQIDTDEISRRVGTDMDWKGKKTSFDDTTSKLFSVVKCTYGEKKVINNNDLKIATGIAWLRTLAIDQSEVGVLKYIVPYANDADRTKDSGTDTMDCSELVCRFFAKIEWSKKVIALNTAGLHDFAEKHPEWLEKHDEVTYLPKAGDIFLWKSTNGKMGHTGIVIDFNAKTDVVTTIEAASTFEKPIGKTEAIKIKGVTLLKWKRTGKHLIGHTKEGTTKTRFYTPKLHYTKANKN